MGSSGAGIAEPDLAFIRRCVREGRLLWTYHVNMRLRQRSVSRATVTESIDSYEIIEEYPRNPASRYLPACLVYAEHRGAAAHIVFALDREGGNVRVITVYRPAPDEWEADLRRRKV